jgi:hypothetical protein
MGPCIVSTFQYISNKMQRYTVYLYLETALHAMNVGPCHHGMAHPQVADGETASYMEGSCE